MTLFAVTANQLTKFRHGILLLYCLTGVELGQGDMSSHVGALAPFPFGFTPPEPWIVGLWL